MNIGKNPTNAHAVESNWNENGDTSTTTGISDKKLGIGNMPQFYVSFRIFFLMINTIIMIITENTKNKIPIDR